jgi:hypothetical protein
MKILLYLDPWIDVSDKPQFKMVWFKKFLPSSIRELITHANLINNFNVEIKVICSDIAEVGIKEDYKFVEFLSISQEELRGIFDSFEDYITLQRSKENNQKFTSLNKIILERLNGFVPDVIIPISSSVKYLKYAFENSLILFNESGIFSRPPFPGSLYFDCSASMDDSFLLKHKNEILALNNDDSQKEFLSKIRKFFFEKLDSRNPYKGIMGMFRKKYSKIVLLSLQRFDSPLFRTQSIFKDQIEYLKYVFDNVDSSIGIIVTEHASDIILNCAVIHDYFKNKYKNFIYIKETEVNSNSSQFLLRMVDGVITVSSTVGLQALLYEKALFVPSKTSYLTAFCDETSLAEISNFFNSGKYKNKDGALYYLLTRYYVLNKYFEDGEWFYNFLNRSLANFRKGVDSNFYERIDSDERLLAHICNQRFVEIFDNAANEVGKVKKPRGIKKWKSSIKKRIAKIKSGK